jgi:hypothetical protein
MVTDALIVTGILVAYFLLVLHAPLVRCPGCWGKRVRHLKRGGRRPPRVIKCPLCDASGICRMPGATTIHRFFWSIAGDHIRGRRPRQPPDAVRPLDERDLGDPKC